MASEGRAALAELPAEPDEPIDPDDPVEPVEPAEPADPVVAALPLEPALPEPLMPALLPLEPVLLEPEAEPLMPALWPELELPDCAVLSRTRRLALSQHLVWSLALGDVAELPGLVCATASPIPPASRAVADTMPIFPIMIALPFIAGDAANGTSMRRAESTFRCLEKTTSLIGSTGFSPRRGRRRSRGGHRRSRRHCAAAAMPPLIGDEITDPRR